MKTTLRCLSVFLLALAAWPVIAQTPPARVLIIGDSMMRVTSHSIELALSKVEGVEAESYSSLGSGLARLDAFDWMAKIDELVASFNPDCTIAWFGTNDRQPIQAGSDILRLHDPGWKAEYARRIGEVMDKLTVKENARVLWLEIPDMREEDIQKDVALINEIAKAEVAKRDRVTFVETRPVLSRKPGTFTMHVPGPTGMPITIRDADGVHLSRAGADKLADVFVKYLFKGGPLPVAK